MWSQGCPLEVSLALLKHNSLTVLPDSILLHAIFIPGVPLLDGGSVRLPYIVGLSRALDLIMTGRPVTAKEAQSMGLVNRVVPNGKAVEEAIKLAKLITRFPQDSLIAERKSVFYSVFNAESFYDALTYEHSKGVKLHTIKDSIKGANEFLEGKGRKGSFDDYLD